MTNSYTRLWYSFSATKHFWSGNCINSNIAFSSKLLHIVPNNGCLEDAKLMTHYKTYKHAKRVSFIYILRKVLSIHFLNLVYTTKEKLHLVYWKKKLSLNFPIFAKWKELRNGQKYKNGSTCMFLWCSQCSLLCVFCILCWKFTFM